MANITIAFRYEKGERKTNNNENLVDILNYFNSNQCKVEYTGEYYLFIQICKMREEKQMKSL